MFQVIEPMIRGIVWFG